MTANHPVHVAVGVILNAGNEVLISFRHPNSHQGGLWEFPGGKVEENETLLHALDREFQEELGIRVNEAFPLLRCHYDYEDKSVLLDVWEIVEYEGDAVGREGQEIAWCSIADLAARDFPAANLPIIRCLQLPRVIAITPELDSRQAFVSCIEHLVAQEVDAIQVRQKYLQADEYKEWFQLATDIVDNRNVPLICNAELQTALELEARGIHLTSSQLMALEARPVSENTLLSTACHDLAELRHAETIRADLALLSPVASTSKYAADKLLGWQQFLSLRKQVSLPVVALGGLRRENFELARQHGAFGIAGIQMFSPG